MAQWEETQEQLRFTMQRNAFGMHMPIRQAMERQLVSHVLGFPYAQAATRLTVVQDPSFPGLNTVGNLHLDILRGKDDSLDLSDVLLCAKEESVATGALDNEFHSVMEKKHRI